MKIIQRDEEKCNKERIRCGTHNISAHTPGLRAWSKRSQFMLNIYYKNKNGPRWNGKR